VTRKDAGEIDSEAAIWIVRFDNAAGDLTELLGDFQRWAAEDPRHYGAFVRAGAMWQLLDKARLPETARKSRKRRSPPGPAQH
jgi:transmembrane sensor